MDKIFHEIEKNLGHSKKLNQQIAAEFQSIDKAAASANAAVDSIDTGNQAFIVTMVFVYAMVFISGAILLTL